MLIGRGVGVAVLMGVALPAWCGDLAKAAERERVRRQAVAARPGRAFTDADLPERVVSEEGPSPVASPTPRTTPSWPKYSSVVQPWGDGPAPPYALDRGSAEDNWREVARPFLERVRDADERIEALRTGKEQHVHESSCPRRKNGGCGSLQTLEEALSLAQAEARAARSALEQLEDAGRRARVPPGWLRER